MKTQHEIVAGRRLLLSGLAAAAMLVRSAAAQTWPTRPVNVILPLQAGSASDVAVRILGDRLGEMLGQRIVVENVTGAAGVIGAERAARAQPDGYTLAALNHSITTFLPAVQRRQLAFDPFEDFVPISGIATLPTFVAVHRDLPVQNIAELIAFARARNGDVDYGSGGAGSPQQLATEMFKVMSGARMNEIGYRGATAATTDLAAGHVQLMFTGHSIALPFLDTGAIRYIAYTGAERHPDYPQLPTIGEQGVAGYDYTAWIALFALKGTPDEVVAKLRAGTAAALAEVPLRERLRHAGLLPWARDPDALRQVMRADETRWRNVVQQADLRL